MLGLRLGAMFGLGLGAVLGLGLGAVGFRVRGCWVKG